MSESRTKILISALLACALALCFIPQGISARANSAIKWWFGTNSSGAFITGESCPVTVERELLTFDIDDFPVDNDNYKAKVTAHYELYNSADYSAEVSLAFPFGAIPSYNGEFTDDAAKYIITADGKEVQKSLRYTLSREEFNTKEDLDRLVDGYRADEFFKPDMPVTKYVYTIYDAVYSGKWDDVYMELQLPKSESYAVFGEYMGDYRISRYIRSGEQVTFYIAGEGFNINSAKWNFFADGSMKTTTAKVRLDETEQMTFKALALLFREGDFAPETDWYNAVVEHISGYKSVSFSSLKVKHMLMGWYLYSLSIPAGGRLVNEVTAPLYPDIHEGYNPYIYRYEYLLSPAKGWASFGTLEVEINTPYCLLDSSPDFEKTEDGFKFVSDGLPDGELTFRLSESQKPKAVINPFAYVLFIIICFAGLMGLAVLATVINLLVLGVIGIIYLKKKRKAKTE